MESRDESLLSSLCDKVDILGKKVDKVYDAIYGVEGHGGLRPWVESQEKRLILIERDLAVAKGKAQMAAYIISGIVSFLTFVLNYFVFSK